MGVKPSVEVKRPDTPEPVEVQDLIDNQEDQDGQPSPSPTPGKQPAKKVLEDLQLKKALEILQEKSQAMKAAG